MDGTFKSIRLVISDFHCVRGEREPYIPDRFGYQLGGSKVYDTGDMKSLRNDPNYLCFNGQRYRIKIRCENLQRMREFVDIFTKQGRVAEIEESLVVEIPTDEDKDGDAFAPIRRPHRNNGN